MANMKRRQFLKSIFGVVAGLVVAPSVVKAKSISKYLTATEISNRLERWRIEAAIIAAKPPLYLFPNKGTIEDFSELNIRPGTVQHYPLGATKEIGFGLSFRKYRYCKGRELTAFEKGWQKRKDDIINKALT